MAIAKDGTVLSDYWLSRWSTLVRMRDGYVCYVCSNSYPSRQCQAHHVYPKSLYPHLAFHLDNGICVCVNCHMPVVHSSEDSWLKFTDFFKRPLRYVANVRFNEEHQPIVCRIHPHGLHEAG